MINIFDNRFDEKQKIIWGLKKVYGIGYHKAELLCRSLGLSRDSIFKDLDDVRQRSLINKIVEEKYLLNLELKREVRRCIEQMVEQRSYKGLRHIYGLPVRGQRTKTNAQSAKGLVGKGMK